MISEMFFCENMHSDHVSGIIDEALRLIDIDIDAALFKFNESFIFAGKSMLKTVHVGSEKRRVWFDLECKESRFVLRQQLRKFNRLNKDDDRLAYVQKRREYKELLRQKKQTYKENLLVSLQTNLNDSKKFWESIRSVRPRSSGRSNITKAQWFDHFKSVFNDDINDDDDDNDDVLVDGEMYVDVLPHDMLNGTISEFEVMNAIRALKANKAAGPDCLIGEFYKNSAECIVPFLVKYFNYIFDKGLFPEEWSMAVLQPLHKKGDLDNPDNFRGISLLNICSKIYSFVLNKRVTKWIESNGLLGEEQAGFREEHCTADHIFTLYAMVQKQLIRHRKLYVAFIDFKKAFDSVSRGKLWGVLRKNGIDGKMLQALKSMYKVVKAKVRVGGDYTDSFLCPRGLKQGEINSPIIFSLFINELTKDILAEGRHGVQLFPDLVQILIMLFADDVALISDSVIGLQTQLNILYNTAKRLDLVVNLDKSNIVVFRNGGYLAESEIWYYGLDTLKVVNAYKYLGIFLSTRISFTATLEDLASRARKGVVAIIRTLWLIGEHSPHIFFKLFDCQILPILTYGAEIWGLTKNQEVIERVHLFALKRFLGVHPKSPRHLVYGETGRLPLFAQTHVKCVKFWLRLQCLNDHRISKKAYNMLLHLQKQNYVTWACSVRNVLYMHGFGLVWEAQGVGDVKAFINCFKERLYDIARQDWHSSLMSHDFYVTYTHYKQSVALCPSLLCVKNFFVRRTLTRFRMGMSELKGNFLQYNPLIPKDRFCPFCPSLLETEFHFLLVCPQYKNIRNDILPLKFHKFPNMAKFAILMSSTNETLIAKLAMFVFKALGVRGITQK
jgi:hypothetical protein